MPLSAKLSLASICVPKYNFGTREEKIVAGLKEWLAGEGQAM